MAEREGWGWGQLFSNFARRHRRLGDFELSDLGEKNLSLHLASIGDVGERFSVGETFFLCLATL